MRSFIERSFGRLRPKRDASANKYPNTTDKAVSFDLKQIEERGTSGNNNENQPQQRGSFVKKSSLKNSDVSSYQPLRKLKSLVNQNESYDKSPYDKAERNNISCFSQQGNRPKNYTTNQSNTDNEIPTEAWWKLRLEPQDYVPSKKNSMDHNHTHQTLDDSLNMLALKSPKEKESMEESLVFDKKDLESRKQSREIAKDIACLQEAWINLTEESSIDNNGGRIKRFASLGKSTARKESDERFKRVYNWRKQHALLIANTRGGNSEDSKLAKEGHVHCEYCYRSFDPLIAQRHIPKCKEIQHRPNPPSHVQKEQTVANNGQDKYALKKTDLNMESELNKCMTFKGKFMPQDDMEERQKPRHNTSSGQRQVSRSVKIRPRTEQTLETEGSLIDYSYQHEIIEKPRENVGKVEAKDPVFPMADSEERYNKRRSTGCSTADGDDKLNLSFTFSQPFQVPANNQNQVQKINQVDNNYRLPPLIPGKVNGYRVPPYEQKANKEVFEKHLGSRERIVTDGNVEENNSYADLYAKTNCPFCSKALPKRSLNSHVPLCRALKNYSTKISQELGCDGTEKNEKYFSVPQVQTRTHTIGEEGSVERPSTNQVPRSRKINPVGSPSDENHHYSIPNSADEPQQKNNSVANPLLNRLRYASKRVLELRKVQVCGHCGSGIPKSHAYCGICGKKKVF